MEFNSVSIVIGATDEEQLLLDTIDEIMDICNREDIEKIIIVKSKNVSEGTEKAVEEAKKKYPCYITDIFQTRPYIGGAVRDCIDIAQSSHIMFISSDMAISLDATQDMIDGAKEHPEVIYKISRWLQKDSFHEYGKIRKQLNKAAQGFLRVLFKSNLTDFTIPVLIAPTSLYKSINFKELNFPMLLEMVLVPVRLGYTFKELPGECFPRQVGKSKNSNLQTAKYLLTAFRVRFTPKSRLLKNKSELQ